MNLRQKYKRAKQRIEMLEKTIVKPKEVYISTTYDIVPLMARYTITRYDRLVFTVENQDKNVTDCLLEEVRKYVEITRESEPYFDGAETIIARLNIAIPRR